MNAGVWAPIGYRLPEPAPTTISSLLVDGPSVFSTSFLAERVAGFSDHTVPHISDNWILKYS
jgi:hypothetical protein